jgi:hypothetical protein
MAFTFKLESPDGTPADPRILRTAVPNWSRGDRIALDANQTLEVSDMRVAMPDAEL